MDDTAIIACFTACSARSRNAAQLLANHQDCLRRSREKLALSRRLLAQPVYPVDHVPPGKDIDLFCLKAGRDCCTWTLNQEGPEVARG